MNNTEATASTEKTPLEISQEYYAKHVYGVSTLEEVWELFPQD